MSLSSHTSIKCPWCQSLVCIDAENIFISLPTQERYLYFSCYDVECGAPLDPNIFSTAFGKFFGFFRESDNMIADYTIRRNIDGVNLSLSSSLPLDFFSLPTIGAQTTLAKNYIEQLNYPYYTIPFTTIYSYHEVATDVIYNVPVFTPYPNSPSTQDLENLIKKFYNLKTFI